MYLGQLKKNWFFSFDFRQNFDVRTFSWWLSIHGTTFFWWVIKKMFPKIFTLVLLDEFLDGFSKFQSFIVKICILILYFWVIFENYSMHMLSRRGNDFIAHWAYEETISSHTEHRRKEFSRMLSQRYNVNRFFTCTSMLSIRGTNFIAHWAYVNEFHRTLSSIRGNV